MGDRFPAAVTDRHALSGFRVAVDRPIDDALRAFGRAPNQSEVAALERVIAFAVVGELRRERPVRAVVLGDHHHAGRILIEPMHDAGPALAADAGKARTAMRNERIDQGAGPMAGGWMNHEIAGFIDDDHIVVFVNDAERDRLGRRLCRHRGRHVNQDGRAGIDVMAWIADRLAIDRDGACFDQHFEPGARQFGDVTGEHAVEPVAGLVGADEDRGLGGRSLGG